MTILCVTCPKSRLATPGYMTCDPCANHIRACLEEILNLYAILSSPRSRLPVVAPSARRGPGFGSRSPANDMAIVLTDPRTTWTPETPVHNPLVVVEGWARMVREDRGEAPPATRATMATEVALLVRRLDWVTRQDWVSELWRELREVRAGLRAFHDIHRPRRVGLCPVVRADDTECSTPLYAPTDGDAIHCGGCGERWPRDRWLLLGQIMTPTGGSAA